MRTQDSRTQDSGYWVRGPASWVLNLARSFAIRVARAPPERLPRVRAGLGGALVHGFAALRAGGCGLRTGLAGFDAALRQTLTEATLFDCFTSLLNRIWHSHMARPV
jgi:hypothetical protein